MTCFRASLNVARGWYTTFLTKRWCKALNGGGTVSLKKRDPRRLPRYPSLISIPELAISLVGKAHVTKMKLNLNCFPLGLQIPQISYCIFAKPVIYTNLITCSAKISLHAAGVVNKFCNTGVTICVYSLIPFYISLKSVQFSKVSSNNIKEVSLKLPQRFYGIG